MGSEKSCQNIACSKRGVKIGFLRMCGRFAQVIKHDELQKLSKELKMQETSEQIELSYNVAPTHTVMAIVAKGELRYPGFFRWGLIPSWMQEMPKTAMFNVRSETIHEKPSFKASFIRRRAIVPVNGFYEWRVKDKQPFFIYHKSEELLYLSAIYDAWEAPDGSFIPSLSIITKAADSFMQNLHHRMPVILSSEQANTFLDPKLQDLPRLNQILIDSAPVDLTAHPVSRDVNKVSNNYPQLIDSDIFAVGL